MRYLQLTLLSNASATGSAQAWPGWRGTFMVEGTFGGATITLQYKTPNGTWMSVGELAALTAAGMIGIECPPGEVRALVAGGSPSALYAYLITNEDT